MSSLPARTGVARALAVAALVALVASIGGCASGAATPDATSSSRLDVVTTTTVFADLVQHVGGDLVHVESLVPRNADVHTFSPRPSDIATVARARLLVMNGLGLDDWLAGRMSNAAPAGTPLIKLGEDLPGVQLLPGDTPNTQNPHLWLDVRYAVLYVQRIAAALAEAEPSGAATFNANAAAYVAELDSLDAWVRQQVASVPVADRKLVTFHDAFPYYAREYGISVVGVAVHAPGQDPSAGYTATLIDTIRTAGVRAIFSEQQFPPKLVDALAAQTGTTVVSTLYDDALGDPPVSSYEAIIRWDTQQLVSALGGTR